MIGSTRSLRVWAYTAAADLRRGFDGLSALVTKDLKRDPLSGDCFLFVNRTRTRAKVLLWDGTGLCLYHKRLESGRFSAVREERAEMTIAELALYLEGAELHRRLSPPPFVPRAERRVAV
jgi:transposase